MKGRRSEDPRNYVLLEEIVSGFDPPGPGKGRRGSKSTERRVLADDENVHQVQSQWRSSAPARFILCERDKVPEVGRAPGYQCVNGANQICIQDITYGLPKNFCSRSCWFRFSKERKRKHAKNPLSRLNQIWGSRRETSRDKTKSDMEGQFCSDTQHSE